MKYTDRSHLRLSVLLCHPDTVERQCIVTAERMPDFSLLLKPLQRRMNDCDNRVDGGLNILEFVS
jgi:hypothetical protein